MIDPAGRGGVQANRAFEAPLAARTGTVVVLLPAPGQCRGAMGVREAAPEWTFEARPGKALKPRRTRRVRTLKPGQPGTKRLVAQYGDRLLCVRYIYDARTGRRLKTVELVLEETQWTPQRARLDPRQLVGIHVGYDELSLREAVKKAGARWDRALQVWVLPYREALRLGLQCRVTHATPNAPGISADGVRSREREE